MYMSAESSLVYLEAGTELFHYSRHPEMLLRRLRFDSEQGKYGGAMFVTPQPTALSNCRGGLLEDAVFYNASHLNYLERLRLKMAGARVSDVIEINEPVDGYFAEVEETYTKLKTPSSYCPEIVFTKDSLSKVVMLYPFPGEPT
jgi:hypothetical protein